MMTVRFPNGQAVQYNTAKEVRKLRRNIMDLERQLKKEVHP